MDFKILSDSQFNELKSRIDELANALNKRAEESLTEKWLTNAEVAKILRVTFRTLQTYRDKGILPFSQVGSKIYYRASDVQAHLEKHYIKRNGGVA